MLSSSVEVLWTARYDYQPQTKLAKHEHAYFQMIYFVSGSGSVYLEQQEYPIKPGSLLLVKPHTAHALNPSSLVKTLDLKFVVKDRWLRGRLMQASELHEENEPGISAQFDRIRHEGEHQGYLHRELCNLFLGEVLLHYLRDDQSQEKLCTNDHADHPLYGNRIVQQAAIFIREHYAEDCTLLQISRAVGKSDRHVRQHFKDVLGISPRRYLLQYRIQKAKNLIEYSGYSFKEIADKVGFKTVHHFTRAFHEVCGETPGAWRRKYQDGICKDVYIDPQFVNTIWTISADSVRDGLGSLRAMA